MPMHLVNKMGEPDAPDERFIDVFDGGKLLTRLVSALQAVSYLHIPLASSPHNTFQYYQQAHSMIGDTPALESSTQPLVTLPNMLIMLMPQMQERGQSLHGYQICKGLGLEPLWSPPMSH